MYDMTGCINHALYAPKEENILIINKWNISQRTNAAFLRCHLVLSFGLCFSQGQRFFN